MSHCRTSGFLVSQIEGTLAETLEKSHVILSICAVGCLWPDKLRHAVAPLVTTRRINFTQSDSVAKDKKCCLNSFAEPSDNLCGKRLSQHPYSMLMLPAACLNMADINLPNTQDVDPQIASHQKRLPAGATRRAPPKRVVRVDG
jgi:hypothetical protein